MAAQGAHLLMEPPRDPPQDKPKTGVDKKVFSREAFYAQIMLVYIISIACIVNLSIGREPSNVWIALLSACLTYLLPAPKIRSEKRIVNLKHDDILLS